MRAVVAVLAWSAWRGWAAGRQSRPCTKSIQSHCAGLDGIASVRKCLGELVGRHVLDESCETLVSARRATLAACRPHAAALCADDAVARAADAANPNVGWSASLSCLRRHRRAAALAGTSCAASLDDLVKLRRSARRGRSSADAAAKREAAREARAARDRRSRIDAILAAMPKAENGGIADEHARLVAAAHMADKEARDTADYLARYPKHALLPEGTHVTATKVGAGSPNLANPNNPTRLKRRSRRDPDRPPVATPPPLPSRPPAGAFADHATTRRRKRKGAFALAQA